MKAIVQLKKENYPILFSRKGLYLSDDSNAHCLLLVIEDGQVDICEEIIDKIDRDIIKSVNNLHGKTVRQVLDQKMKGGESTLEMEQIQKYISNKLSTT